MSAAGQRQQRLELLHEAADYTAFFSVGNLLGSHLLTTKDAAALS